ncbi:FAD-binding domain-containing protein [Polyplosphaeria fusca]|uniref:FAD-binding domain-containing protein n=1 Tax=Polyplosphaeria fusca TaxID=682080 RepID=A0A9P4QJE8_9PLEO|nr:FAD-binding domain-containing protein [Polyplosphaeria fusca]
MKSIKHLSLILHSLLCWASSVIASNTSYSSKCKCFPGDDCWPSASQWNKLNETVNGQLIETVPLGSPCHDPNYDSNACDALREQWLYSGVHMESSSSVMAPLFANQSCDPFQPRSRPCALGNYVSYTVNATNADDAIAAVEFARENNIRFVIRNTGHDYLGRSTGAGALAVWTYHLKAIEVLDWADTHYSGKAMEIGAGVQGFEALAAAKEEGLIVVTGECPSVGLAGGYIQGGGHSALSTSFGLAADNVLSYEVVTAIGQLVIASRTVNTDLYWALSGGGGGNYGIVVSVTVAAHSDASVGGASFLVTESEANTGQIFDIVDAWHEALPAIVDSGVMAIYFFSDTFLQIPALTAYKKTASEVRQMLQPFADALADMNITLEVNVTDFASYHEHYNNYWGPLPEGNIQVGTQLFGGRLIPRNVLPNFSPTAKKLAQMGVIFIGVGLNVSSFSDDAISVLPQWRDSIVQSSLTLPWDFEAPWEDMLATQQKIKEQVQPTIEAATPGAGAYVNEADFQQDDWQETFYGKNYAKLLEVKTKWDPDGLLYAVVGVGSERWSVGSDGRMCEGESQRKNHEEL